MSRRTLAALAAVNAGGCIALARHWILARRRLHEAEEELVRLRRQVGEPAPPPDLRGDGDLASEWEQAVAPMDS